MRKIIAKMRNVISSRRAILQAAGAGALLLASPALAQAPAAKLKIVASFSILADITRQIAGERADVTALVGPNSDAHVYRATPQDAKTLKEADLIVMNGLGFEGFMPRLIKSSGTKAPVITATNGIVVLKPDEKKGHHHGHGHDHGKADPHAWQSIEAVRVFVSNIRNGLIERDSANAALYRSNADGYLAQLDALKAEIEKAIAAIPAEKRILVTNHDAFGYFAREFGVRFESVQGISTEGEPSARDIARVIKVAKEKKARAVFVENMSDPRIGTQLAKETGAKLGGALFSDALSDEKGAAPSYIALMKHNARAIAEALKD